MVSCRLGQETLRSSDRTSRTKSSGLPRPRLPPAPANGIAPRAGALLLATAAPRLRPPAPTTAPRRPCSRFSPGRALLDCVLLGWATKGILSLHPGVRQRTQLGPSASEFYHATRVAPPSSPDRGIARRRAGMRKMRAVPGDGRPWQRASLSGFTPGGGPYCTSQQAWLWSRVVSQQAQGFGARPKPARTHHKR